MKLLYAPDCSDHPNWGCRYMGDWYRNALAAVPGVNLRRIGSRWFFQQDARIPAPANFGELQRIAETAHRNDALANVAAALAACDCLFMNAENFIRPLTLKGRRLLMLAYLAKTVFAKPVLLANASLDLSEPALAELVAQVLPLLDEVQLRDDTSATRYAALVPGVHFSRCIDVGWTAMPAPAQAWAALALRDGQFAAWPDHSVGFDATRPYLTVCASSAFAQPDAANPTEAFVDLCRRLADEVAPVVLVAPCEVDARIMRKVQAATGLPLLGLNLPVQQGIDVLGNARVHVGGRWHPGIFAATGGTPLVAFGANTHKMHSLMAGLHPGEPVFDPARIGEQVDAIVARARAQRDAGEALRARVRDHAATMRAQVAGNLDIVERMALLSDAAV